MPKQGRCWSVLRKDIGSGKHWNIGLNANQIVANLEGRVPVLQCILHIEGWCKIDPANTTFFVAEVFTGSPGVYVELEDTIKGFKAIVAGEYDDLPEQAFYMVGTIEDAVDKAKKLAAEAA